MTLPVTVGTSTSAPEHELRVGDEHLAVEILAVALEARIFLDLEDDEDVAASDRRAVRRCRHRASSCTDRSRRRRGFAPESVFSLRDASFAPALLARRGDDGPFARARRTRRDADDLPEERASARAELRRCRAHVVQRFAGSFPARRPLPSHWSHGSSSLTVTVFSTPARDLGERSGMRDA